MATPEPTVTNTDVDLLDFASTTKLVEVPIDGINNYEIDRVTDKIDSYQSHKDFLLECIREKVIPMGLRQSVIIKTSSSKNGINALKTFLSPS